MPDDANHTPDRVDDTSTENKPFETPVEPAPIKDSNLALAPQTTWVDSNPSQPQPVAQPEAQAQPIVQSDVPQVTMAHPVSIPQLINNPLVLVLQWLTYAFWGWTALSLSILTWISLNFYFEESSSDFGVSSTISYPLAAVLVLFAISFVCDSFYSKQEPERKVGAAMVIMVIHAVLFALFGIGWIISAVFGAISLGIGPEEGSNASAVTTIITGLIMAAVYGATLLRTVKPAQIKRIRVLYAIFMAVVTITVSSMGIFGPVMNAHETKDDRLIERGLSGVSGAIRNYSAKSDSLPRTLSEVRDQASADARTLIDRQLVEYSPGKKVVRDTQTSFSKTIVVPASQDTYSYTLCVTYKAKKGDQQYYRKDGGYNMVEPDTYYHDAGRVCYDLQTGYNDY